MLLHVGVFHVCKIMAANHDLHCTRNVSLSWKFYVAGISVEFEASFVVITGSHAMLSCRATGYDPSVHSISSFVWRHNNSVISVDGAKYSVTGTDESGALTIATPLTFEDGGVYSCTIEYSLMAGQSQLAISGQDTLRIASKHINLLCFHDNWI